MLSKITNVLSYNYYEGNGKDGDVGRTEKFGAMVKAARLKCGWVQQELADRTGVSQGNISDVERGNPPKLDTACNLMVVLDLDPYEVCINIIEEFPEPRQQIPPSWGDGRADLNGRIV